MFGLQFTADDVVLDVGCGLGDVCVAAGNAGSAVIAIDIVPATLDHARRRMEGVPARSFESYVSDCSPIPLPDQTCSIVVAQEVLEHTTNPTAFLAELARVGKAGCRYLISVPSANSESLLKTVAPPEYFQAPNHVHIFSMESLEQLVGDAGLRIVSRHKVGFYWSLWWMFKMAGEAAVPHWEAAWAELQKHPNAALSSEHLDALIPKSDVLVCQK